jgi:hypothetical protein
MRSYQVMLALGLGLVLGGFAMAIHPNPQTMGEWAPSIMAFLGGALMGLATPIIVDAIRQEQ